VLPADKSRSYRTSRRRPSRAAAIVYRSRAGDTKRRALRVRDMSTKASTRGDASDPDTLLHDSVDSGFRTLLLRSRFFSRSHSLR